jgi:hypothetical protein
MAIVTATQKREKEGEEGRERREKGQYRVGQGVRAPSDVRTGGTRRREERRQEGRRATSDIREQKGTSENEGGRQDETEDRGNEREEAMCCAKRDWKNSFM